MIGLGYRIYPSRPLEKSPYALQMTMDNRVDQRCVVVVVD